jgi:hypothetical protein
LVVVQNRINLVRQPFLVVAHFFQQADVQPSVRGIHPGGFRQSSDVLEHFQGNQRTSYSRSAKSPAICIERSIKTESNHFVLRSLCTPNAKATSCFASAQQLVLARIAALRHAPTPRPTRLQATYWNNEG